MCVCVFTDLTFCLLKRAFLVIFLRRFVLLVQRRDPNDLFPWAQYTTTMCLCLHLLYTICFRPMILFNILTKFRSILIFIIIILLERKTYRHFAWFTKKWVGLNRTQNTNKNKNRRRKSNGMNKEKAKWNPILVWNSVQCKVKFKRPMHLSIESKSFLWKVDFSRFSILCSRISSFLVLSFTLSHIYIAS